MKNMVAFGARKEKSSESSDSDVSTDSEDYHVMLNKWLNLKNENPRLQHELHIKKWSQRACHEVRRDVRQGVRQEVLQRVALVQGRRLIGASATVSGQARSSRMCCWFCGKVGHKKVECFAHGKSRNMAKKVNKTFTKPRRVEEVSLAKSGLLDEIKDETSEDACSSVRSDLQEDQEESSVESGHGVVCDTKGKEIKVRQEVRALGADGEGLMVKETAHEGSQVLNRSGSRGSSTGASDRDAVLVIPLQQGLCHDYT
ncbi:hypothetical protein F2Q70_00015358 [Brassica cretica]|uniref:CCHC-type domain-containing protein n=1 Tax=Brassica cretica TaxID=69181 RepID=A0A8S9I1Z2_BRACR|nr:hypothetical protein F2Q70_00015358 [Brassica cretica]